MAKTTLLLPVKLTDPEVLARGGELAVAELERQEALRAVEDGAEEWKEEKKGLENAVSRADVECRRLSRIVRERQEDREVECQVEIGNGQYRAIRLDTGEVALERAASAAELQMSIADVVDDKVDGIIEKPEPPKEESGEAAPPAE